MGDRRHARGLVHGDVAMGAVRGRRVRRSCPGDVGETFHWSRMLRGLGMDDRPVVGRFCGLGGVLGVWAGVVAAGGSEDEVSSEKIQRVGTILNIQCDTPEYKERNVQCMCQKLLARYGCETSDSRVDHDMKLE